MNNIQKGIMKNNLLRFKYNIVGVY